jgi:uncharacterized protein
MKGGTKMSEKNAVRITIIISATIIILTLIIGGFFIGFRPVSGNTISAQGYSSLRASPDLVTVHFNIETKGLTAKEAKDANLAIVEKLNLELTRLGIEKRNIQTQSINIYEDQVWEKDRMIKLGYKATHQIKIVLDTNESELISLVIDKGVDSGALISYINFELSPIRQSEYKSEALKLAGEDAKLQAIAIAEGVEKRLGRLVSVSNSDFYYQPWNIYSVKEDRVTSAIDISEAKLAITNISPGDQNIDARVVVIYKIK